MVRELTQMAPGGFWSLLSVLSALALLALYFAFRNLHRARLIEDTPTSRIRSAHQGYVELIGEAAMMRGETIQSINVVERELPANTKNIDLPEAYYRKNRGTQTLPPLVYTPSEMKPLKTVGKPELKVDGIKLVKGKPAFTGDSDDAPDPPLINDTDLSRLEEVLPDGVNIAGVRLVEDEE